MADKKKGDYRVVVSVEILKDHGLYKKGDKPQVHPELAKQLVAQEVAKTVKA